MSNVENGDLGESDTLLFVNSVNDSCADDECDDVQSSTYEQDDATKKLEIFCCLSPTERHIQRLNSDLLSAIESGNTERFHECLQEGAELNATCRDTGYTACHTAVLFDRCELLVEVLNRGANDSIPSFDGYLPFHFAAFKECQTCLKTLVERNSKHVSAAVTVKNNLKSRTSTSLDSWDHSHQMLYNSMMHLLIPGSTALHIACRRLNASCVEYLLSKKADPELKDSRNMTPLDVVNDSTCTVGLKFETGQKSTKSYRSSERSLDQGEAGNVEPVAVAGTATECDAISKIIFLLIEHVAASSPTSTLPDKKLTSLLNPAVITQNEKLLKILINHNVDLDVRDEYSNTTLHLAVRLRLKRSLLVLVSSEKARLTLLEACDFDGKTPLLLAVSDSWNYGVSVLLEVGANVTAVSSTGDTVLHFAAATNNVSILTELLTFPEINRVVDKSNGDLESPVMVAVRNNSLACVQKLIDSGGASLRTSTHNHYTVIHVAAKKGFVEILKFLLGQRDSLVRDARTGEGETALHLAASVGNVECVQLLLAEGSSIQAETINSYIIRATSSSSLSPIVESFDFGSGTALHCAAVSGNLPVIRYLISYEPNLVNLVNKKGWCPLHVAAYFKHPECVQYIVQHGGNLSKEVRYLDGRRRSTFDIISYNFNDPIGFLESLFDVYMETNEHPLNHPDFSITFRFDVLAPNGEDKKQMKVLKRLLNTKNEHLQQRLLSHPLVETFLHLKWNQLRTFFIVSTLLLHTIFTISLTSFALLQQIQLPTVPPIIFVIAMFISLIPLLLQEILQASRLQWYYLTDLETWVKWTTFGTAFFLCIATLRLWKADFLMQSKHLLPITVLFSWIEILFLLSRLPNWGFYVLMFFRVTYVVVKVFCTFGCLLFGFAITFFILFQGSSPFPSLEETFVKTMVLMFEFDYSTMFADQPGRIARLIFVLFVVLIPIVLMNLMIGLAVSDIAALEAQGRSQTLAKQIEFLSLLETFVYSKRWLSWTPKRLRNKLIEHRNISNTFTIRPGQPGDVKFRKLPSNLKRVIFTKLAARIQVADVNSRTDLLHRLSHIMQELESIKKTISNGYSRVVLIIITYYFCHMWR